MFSLERCSVPPLRAVTAGVCWRTMSRGSSCDYGNSGDSAARICGAGMLGMLDEIAVGLAGLVQFGDAGTLVLE